MVVTQVLKLFLAWAWLAIAKAQDLSGPVTSTVSFLDAGLTTLGHVAAFVNCFLRGRLDVEVASRDLLISLSEKQLLQVSGSNNVSALCTDATADDADVIFMTTNFSDPVMRSFMKHVAVCYDLHSLVVSCLPLQKVALAIEECVCASNERCACLCVWATTEIIEALVIRMPGIVKQVSSELYIFPSTLCFRAGCHGCSHDMLIFVEGSGLSSGEPQRNSIGAICGSLSVLKFDPHRQLCFTIPVFAAENDSWSKLLLTILRTKDAAERDLLMEATEALDLYIRGQRPIRHTKWELQKATVSLPRLVEMVLNVVLTAWFRVDGFSSALVSRRTGRNYLVNSVGNGLHAGVFLSSVTVHADPYTSHICESLRFCSPRQSLRPAALIGATVNAICTIWWIAAVSLHKGLGNWSNTYSRPPTLFRLTALIGGIGIALAMDSTHAYQKRHKWKDFPLLWAAMAVETLTLATIASVLGVFGIAVFGTWIYGVTEALVWMKWAVGCYLLGCDVIFQPLWHTSGILVYSSAFLLAAILAAVGGNWK